jgi:hypothetical protein
MPACDHRSIVRSEISLNNVDYAGSMQASMEHAGLWYLETADLRIHATGIDSTGSLAGCKVTSALT